MGKISMNLMYAFQNVCCSVARVIDTMKNINLKGHLHFWACGFVDRDNHDNLNFTICYSKALLQCSEGCLDHEFEKKIYHETR